MCMREAVDDIVGVMIAARSVPVVDSGVRRKLHHPEWQRRAGKSMPVPARADERIHPARKVFCLGNKRQAISDKQQTAETQGRREIQANHKSSRNSASSLGSSEVNDIRSSVAGCVNSSFSACRKNLPSFSTAFLISLSA